jgi:hypothetical protein
MAFFAYQLNRLIAALLLLLSACFFGYSIASTSVSLLVGTISFIFGVYGFSVHISFAVIIKISSKDI